MAGPLFLEVSVSSAADSAAPARAYASLGDEALHAYFVETRASAAFDELARRFQGFAFRVAYCVCAQAELAEEAAQEAFVQLAREDAGFRSRGAGSFRAWFYRLVAHVAHTHSRAERRSMRRVKSRRFLDEAHSIAQARAESATAPAPAAPAADGEALAAVRNAIGSLAEELRAPIVMHYIEGLSQADVARTVGVSAAQISRRIAKGLEMLRRQVAESGASLSLAALPALLQHEALLPAPPSLGAKLAGLNLKALAAEGARQSLRAAASKGSAALLLPAVLAASFAAAAGAWWWASKETKARTSAGVPEEKEPWQAPAPSLKDFSAEWSFEQGIPEGFRVVEGRPEWQPARESMPAGCRMPGRMDVENIFLLPVEAPERGPFVVRMVGFPDEYANWKAGVSWAHETRLVLPKSSGRVDRPLKFNQLYTFEFYFRDRFVVARLFETGAQETPSAVFNALEFERWRPADRLCFSADNWVIRSLSLAPIAEAAIPADVRALEALVANGNRHGHARKPEFAGPDGPETAFLDGFERAVAYRRTWTFENGMPEDLKTDLLPTKVARGGKKGTARLVTGHGTTSIFFPPEVPVAPLKVRVRAIMNPPDPSFDAVWAHDQVTVPSTTWWRSVKTNAGGRYDYTVYLAGAYSFELRDGELFQVTRFDRPWPARRLVLGVRDMEIEELEVETLQSLDELPEIARNPAKAIATFERPPRERKGFFIADAAIETFNPDKK